MQTLSNPIILHTGAIVRMCGSLQSGDHLSAGALPSRHLEASPAPLVGPIAALLGFNGEGSRGPSHSAALNVDAVLDFYVDFYERFIKDLTEHEAGEQVTQQPSNEDAVLDCTASASRCRQPRCANMVVMSYLHCAPPGQTDYDVWCH